MNTKRRILISLALIVIVMPMFISAVSAAKPRGFPTYWYDMAMEDHEVLSGTMTAAGGGQYRCTEDGYGYHWWLRDTVGKVPTYALDVRIVFYIKQYGSDDEPLEVRINYRATGQSWQKLLDRNYRSGNYPNGQTLMIDLTPSQVSTVKGKYIDCQMESAGGDSQEWYVKLFRVQYKGY